MVVAEEMATAGKSCPVQVFATDVDEAALEFARLGIYPESIVADVEPERLAKFFMRKSLSPVTGERGRGEGAGKSTKRCAIRSSSPGKT